MLETSENLADCSPRVFTKFQSDAHLKLPEPLVPSPSAGPFVSPRTPELTGFSANSSDSEYSDSEIRCRPKQFQDDDAFEDVYEEKTPLASDNPIVLSSMNRQESIASLCTPRQKTLRPIVNSEWDVMREYFEKMTLEKVKLIEMWESVKKQTERRSILKKRLREKALVK